MAHIVDYVAHDPVGNCEGQVTTYNLPDLIDAEAQGIVFIAVYDDGTRAVVRAADIVKPSMGGQDFVFVMPVYVDDRTQATCDVFDALGAIIDPQAATVADGGATAQAADPIAAFKTALAKLHELAEPESAQPGGDAK